MLKSNLVPSTPNTSVVGASPVGTTVKRRTVGYKISKGDSSFVLSNEAADWIRARSQRDYSQLYTSDPEDVARKSRGEVPIAVDRSYSSSEADAQLRKLNLPSTKLIFDYAAAYSDWYGDGTTYTFDKDARDYIGTKFRNSWEYEYTVEDQQRKAQGLVPIKVAAEYKDSYTDSQLLSMGLPPQSKLSDYTAEYDERLYTSSRIDQFYTAVTQKWIENTLLGKTSDQDGETAFLDTLGEDEWSDVAALYRERETPADETATDSALYSFEDYEASTMSTVKARQKAEKTSGDLFVSYEDFTAKEKQYEKQLRTVRLSEDFSAAYGGEVKTVGDALDYTAEQSEAASISRAADSKEGVLAYITEHSDLSATDILKNLFEGGVNQTRLNAARKAMRKSAATPEERTAIETAYSGYVEQYKQKRKDGGIFSKEYADEQKEKTREQMDVAYEGVLEKRAYAKQNGLFVQYIADPYQSGSTSTVSVDEATSIFKSHLVYDKKGNPSEDSVKVAKQALADAGATAPIIRQVVSALYGKQEAFARGLDVFTTGTAGSAAPVAYDSDIDEIDVASRTALAETVRKTVVGSGQMTDFEFDQMLRRNGWADAIPDEQAAKDYFTEAEAPRYAENGEILTPWEQLDDQSKESYTATFIENAPFNPEIHKSADEIIVNRAGGAFMSVFSGIISGVVSFADMVTGKDQWKITEQLAKFDSRVSNWGRSNQSAGSEIYAGALDIASEVARMYLLSVMGSGIAGMFSKGASVVGGALAQTNFGNALSAISANSAAVTKGLNGIVKGVMWTVESSPFITTSMGSYYSEALAGGATVQQATIYGAVCGALEGATEAVSTSMWLERGFGSAGFAKQIIKSGDAALAGSTVVKAKLINLVASAAGEFLEESASYAGSIFMQRRTYNKDAKFDVVEMFKQGGMGALVGFVGAGLGLGSIDSSSIMANFLSTDKGMQFATGDAASQFRDLMFATVSVDGMSEDTKAMLQMQDGALEMSDYEAVVRDIGQQERQLNSDAETYSTDIAKVDAELQSKQSAYDAAFRVEQQAASDTSTEGIAKWGEAVKAMRVAKSELAVEQAQHEAKKTERTRAFEETTAQHKTALEKAQRKILSHAVSTVEAFTPELKQMRAYAADSSVVVIPNEFGRQVMAKMNAMRAGKLMDYVQAYSEAQAAQTSQAAPEAAGAAQFPVGENVAMFSQNAAEAAPVAQTATTAPTSTEKPANVAMFDQAKTTVGEKAIEAFNESVTERGREPLSFSKAEIPFVDSAIKAVSSMPAEIERGIRAEFPYSKSIIGMDYVSESLRDMALRVLSGDAEYLDGENLTKQIERVLGTVRIDFVPTEVGLLGHDGYEIRDIRNQIRKTKISIGAQTAAGFVYSVDDTIRTDKSLFGTIRLSKSANSQSADALYYELSNAYPDLFDPEVINPSDQIRVMADFVKRTYNGSAEALSKIKSGEYVYYLAHDVAEKFVARTMDSYFGVVSLKSGNGGKPDGEVGTIESAKGIVAETSGGSAEETGGNEAGIGENKSSTEVTEPTAAEPTIKKVETPAKPSGETMGIVDPRLQEGVSAFRRFGRAAYKRIVSGSMGTERASRVQKKLGIGGASIDSSAQGIRNAQGTAQYILGDALVDIDGTYIGKSLVELFRDIPQEKWADFQTYLLAKHTESRMTLEQRGYGNDKPVLASESGALDPDGNPTAMDANEAAAIAAKLEAENPNFKAIRESYRSWWSGFMRSWAVDGGLMTETQFNALDAKYPDYVPTYRVDKNSVGGASSATRTSVTVSSAIRNATGSTDEIQDIRISLSDMVKRYVTMERRNELVQNLFNFAETHTKAAAEFATIFDEESGFSPDVDFVSFDELANKDAAEVKDGQYIIRGFHDGERVSMHVSKDVYDAINYLTNPSDVSVRSQHENEILKGARAISRPIKGVITGYNPFFALMNFARDAQTYFVNTKATIGDTFTNIGRAVTERKRNSALWQSYLALGGNLSGYITSQQMTDASVTGKGKVANVVKKAGEAIGWLGGYTENMFRFAEYINGVNKYGDTAEGRRNAMADAADVTVNFSRSGAYTKAADAFCLYLNANVQGLDKMARTIANNPGKTALRGLSLAAIALLLRYITGNDDNPHYQNLTNYVKDSSYCIPNVLGERDDNGYCTTFIKIPKSREYGALIVATLERAARWVDGSESFDDAFADLGKDIGTSIGIRMEPFWTASQAAVTNKNYFGSDIVPMYMQDEAAPDQTTAQTSVISDAISERLYEMGVEVSPLVMDYIINQYGGFYGQLLTSATAKDANGIVGVLANIVTDKFVADPLYQSGAVSRFYDAMDNAQYFARQSQREREALGIGTESVDEQYYDALGDYKKQLAALRKDERAILSQEDDTPERKAKIDKIREQMNEVANAGLDLWAKRGK